jgi:hypothetical protein
MLQPVWAATPWDGLLSKVQVKASPSGSYPCKRKDFENPEGVVTDMFWAMGASLTPVISKCTAPDQESYPLVAWKNIWSVPVWFNDPV